MSGLIFIAGYGMDNNWNNFNYMLGSVVQFIRTVQACCEAMMIIRWRIELSFNARSLFHSCANDGDDFVSLCECTRSKRGKVMMRISFTCEHARNGCNR